MNTTKNEKMMQRVMMMAVLAIGLFFTGLVQAQTNKLITQNSVGPINIEMTVAEARKAVAPMTLSRRSDGEGIALIAVKDGENEVLTLYAKETDAAAPIDENALIEQIYVWDETYKTEAGVHPKMMLSNVETHYGKVMEITLSEIESREYATFENQLRGMSFRVEGSPKAGNYAENERTTTRYSNGAIVLAIEVIRPHYPNENPDETKVKEETPFETFWTFFKSAVEKGDKQEVAGFSKFPLSMPHGWEEMKTEADFIKNYDQIFNSESIDAARCFKNATFEKRDEHYEVACAFKSEPVDSERKPWVFHFELASSGWEFVRLDNTNE